MNNRFEHARLLASAGGSGKNREVVPAVLPTAQPNHEFPHLPGPVPLGAETVRNNPQIRSRPIHCKPLTEALTAMGCAENPSALQWIVSSAAPVFCHPPRLGYQTRHLCICPTLECLDWLLNTSAHIRPPTCWTGDRVGTAELTYRFPSGPRLAWKAVLRWMHDCRIGVGWPPAWLGTNRKSSFVE